jgi:hypothetical protein
MMKNIKVLFILPLFLFAFQSVKLEKTKIGKSITVDLPDSFILMTQSEINLKYVSVREPLALYSDETRNVDLSVNVAFSKWNAGDLELMKSFYKSSIMGLYDEVHFVKERIEDINGRRFAVFEFVSAIRAESNSPISANVVGRYTYIQYAIVNGKTVLFNLSCPTRLKDKWAPIAQEIMNSVKIKDSL